MSWWAILFSSPLALFLNSGRKARAFTAFVIAFITLVILMGFERLPYRLGWGDSANRIFTHLFPIITLGIMTALATTRWTPTTAAKPDTDNRGSSSVPLLKTVIIGFVFSTSVLIQLIYFYF